MAQLVTLLCQFLLNWQSKVTSCTIGKSYRLFQEMESLLDAATVRRETRALWELMSEQNLDEGFIIVADGIKREYEQDGRVIHQILAWQWFLDATA